MLDNPEILIGLLSVAGSLIAAVWLWLKAKWPAVAAALEKTTIDEFAEAAAVEVYLTYVREIKAASADGSLTPEEKKQAMEKAIEVFKQVAKEKGKAELAALARPLIQLAIEKAVARFKKD